MGHENGILFGPYRLSYLGSYTKWNGLYQSPGIQQDQIKVLPCKDCGRNLSQSREEKARTLWLIALPEDHLAKFHKMTDAKEMWEAIKSSFASQLEYAIQKFLRSYLSAFSSTFLNMRISQALLHHPLACINVDFVSETTQLLLNDIGKYRLMVFLIILVITHSMNKLHHTPYLQMKSSCPQLDHEDLEQLDEFDLEEMDLNMASGGMIS
ncbi:hypothetical protein Tco_1227243 [Tanacetum coccineum]